MSRPLSAEEVQSMLLDRLAKSAEFWASAPDLTTLERCNGVLRGFLLMMAGDMTFPRIELTLRPEEGDETFREIEGMEGCFVDGQRIDEPPLHTIWPSFERTNGRD